MSLRADAISARLRTGVPAGENQEMHMQTPYSQSIKGSINFSADRIERQGITLATQALLPVELDISNMRALTRPTTLENQGFVLTPHARGRGDWSDPAWVNGAYVDSCVDLVKRLTAATTAFQIGAPVYRNSAHDKSAADVPVSTCVHIDLTREMACELAQQAAARQNVRFGRGAMYNVWKTHTPSPQDSPLAVCDWRTIPTHDHVTRFYGDDDPVKTVAVAYTPHASKWYYTPDMNADESLVFVGADMDADHPLGCAHSAFAPGWPDAHSRASIEIRVLAFFE
jgi:hypothetical protein